jgi:hypothetical protein
LGIWYISEIFSHEIGYGNDYKLETCLPIVIFLVALNILHSYASKFWLVTFVAGISVVVIWLIFLIGASKQVQFPKYADTGRQSHNIGAVTDTISIGIWFFVSLAAIPTIAGSIAMVRICTICY